MEKLREDYTDGEKFFATEMNKVTHAINNLYDEDKIIPEDNTPYGIIDIKECQYNMSIVCQVILNSDDEEHVVYDTDPNDCIIALYQNKPIGIKCMAEDSIVYLTVHGTPDMRDYDTGYSATVDFQLWQSSTGRLFNIKPNRKIVFAHGFVYGATESAVQFSIESETQIIPIKSGWNWISIDLVPLETELSVNLRGLKPFTNGDEIKNPNTRKSNTYSSSTGTWQGNLEESLHHTQMYMLHVAEDNTLLINGTEIPQENMIIRVKGQGQWSVMPCLYHKKVPVNIAFGKYHENASHGDLIKSKDEFSYFSENEDKWIGALEYITPGEGYLFRCMGSSVDIEF